MMTYFHHRRSFPHTLVFPPEQIVPQLSGCVLHLLMLVHCFSGFHELTAICLEVPSCVWSVSQWQIMWSNPVVGSHIGLHITSASVHLRTSKAEAEAYLAIPNVNGISSPEFKDIWMSPILVLALEWYRNGRRVWGALEVMSSFFVTSPGRGE